METPVVGKDVSQVKEQIAQSLFDHRPVGVESKGMIPVSARNLEEALDMGMDWSLREGYVWTEDMEHYEEYGRMLNADPTKVSMRAKNEVFRNLAHWVQVTTMLKFKLSTKSSISGAHQRWE